MQTKLTLSLDEDVIKLAKDYASKKNSSISKIVEEYFSNLGKIDEKINARLTGEITDRISGLFSNDYKGNSYKEILEDALLEKYL